MSKVITTINDLDHQTIHGLMRSLTQAHYTDALNVQYAVRNGNKPPIQTNAQSLQQSIVGLIDAVGEAMRTGELTPFHGNYVEWLIERGFVDRPNTEEAVHKWNKEQVENGKKQA